MYNKNLSYGHPTNKPEVAAQIRVLPFGKKHPVRTLLEEMKEGEILRISRQDFTWKGKTNLRRVPKPRTRSDN